MKQLLFAVLVFSVFSGARAQKTVLMRDDFNVNQHGWLVKDDENTHMEIKDGVYKFSHKPEKGAWLTYNTFYVDPFKDFVIEASFVQKEGVDNNGYGLVWGAEDSDNAFCFTVTSNNFFSVYGYRKGAYFKTTEWLKSEHIKPMGLPNRLEVRRAGNTLFFKVNHRIVHSMPFQEFMGQKIGFVLNNNMKVEIDYLEIRQDRGDINLVTEKLYGNKKEHLGPNINSEFTEKMPVISADGKTIYVDRSKHPGNTGSDKANDDIWVSQLQPDGSWGKLANVGFPLNNPGHNFVVSVMPDNNTMLLANTYKEDGSKLGAGFSITTRTKTGWSIPEKVVMEKYYNNSDYTEACLAPGGNVLIFTADRNDSYGLKDIYVSFLKADGRWSEPMNVGNTVNSYADETSPFLASDGVSLYFSSAGHPGYGENDIFVTKRLDDTWKRWSKPQNLGPEINSKSWDAYYTIPASGKEAYFASTEGGISGSLDIFKVTLPEEARPEPVVLLHGKVLNSKTNEPMHSEITYRVLGSDKVVGKAISDPNTGEYKIVLPGGKKYSFHAVEDGFVSVSNNLDFTGLKSYEEKNIDLLLTPYEVGQSVVLNNIFFEPNSAKLLRDSYEELDRLVKMMRDNPKMKIRVDGHTSVNERDEKFNMALSLARAQAVMDYVLKNKISKSRMSAKGYGFSKPLSSNDSYEQRALNRRVEFVILEN